jgi:PAS domain S-box-containing protein
VIRTSVKDPLEYLYGSLSQSEEQFRGFMESASERFVIFDKDMHFKVVNDSWLQRVSLNREDVIGKHVLEVFPRLKETEQYDEYLKVLETGEPVVLQAVESVAGDQNIVDISAFKARNVLGIVARDVSENVKYSRRLEALHHHAVSLGATETLDDIIEITCNCLIETLEFKRGSLGFVEGDNLVFNNHWGYESNEHISMPLDGPGFTVKAVNTRESLIINDANKSDIYASPLSEYPAQSELDVPVIVEGEAVAVINIESMQNDAFSLDDQQLIETLAMHMATAIHRIRTVEEKTGLESELFEERVRSEQEKELSRLKTQFMNTATHEIRTPITSIKGYTELILETLEKGDVVTVQKYFEVISRNVERLEVLSNDLLDLQRLESGRIDLTLQFCSVNELLGELESLIRPIVDRSGHMLRIKIDESLEFMCDKARINQVLVNLVNNAWKYSPVGSEVSVEVNQTDVSVLFSIIDHGVGLSDEDISKLFIAFPDIQVKEYSHGSGLGLSICKGIVELHGGEIWAESEGHGKGSKFSFTIPIEQ